jgi:hypothetical protein
MVSAISATFTTLFRSVIIIIFFRS